VVDLALLGWALSADRPIFDISALRFVGAVSYSWYLYHAAIGYPILAALHSDAILGGLAAIAAATLATFIVAYLSYRYIERSGIAIGRRLALAAAPLDRGQS
jgi:peptidoglycan/LPS O-acetylase OafA/YrhL